jgi:rod shape-determining protein MreC
MAVSGRSLRRRYVLALLVLTAVTLIALDARAGDSGPLGAVGSAVHEVVGPVRRAASAVARPVGDWFEGMLSAGSLEEENEDLRAALAEARAGAARNEDALAQLRDLSALLDLPFVEGLDTITAHVISPAAGNFEHTLVIGKGSSAGVRVGLPVVASRGLLGRVVEVTPNQAKVMLLTDQRFSVAVRSARDRLTGVAAGNGSSQLDLAFIEAVAGVTDAPVLVVGDSIVTSGLDASLYPPGIPVGTIAEVTDEPTTSRRTATLNPFVDLDAVEVVQVLDWDPLRDEPAATAPVEGEG